MKITTFKLLALSSLLFALSITAKSQTWQELDSLRMHYQNKQDYVNALMYAEKCLEEVGEKLGVKDSIYADMLENIAYVYFYMGNHSKALQYVEEEMLLRKEIQGEQHSKYLICLNNMATLNSELKNFNEALMISEVALKATEGALGKDSYEYGLLLHNIAFLYSELGQYENAITYHKCVLDVFEKAIGKKNTNYAYALNGMASTYSKLQDYENAIPLYVEAISIIEEIQGKSHSNFHLFQGNLALLYIRIGEHEKALEIFLEGIANIEKTVGKSHPTYSARLNNLGLLYLRMQRYEDAKPILLESRERTIVNFGKEHESYGVRCFNVAAMYVGLNDLDNAYAAYLETIDNTMFSINKVFGFLSEDEKEHFINTIKKDFEVFQNFFLKYSTQNPEAGAHAFNIELATKGMILQSGIEMRQTIINSGDKVALEKYDEWISLRAQISDQYSLRISDRREDLLEMQQTAKRLEGDLTRLSGAFNQANRLTNATWKDVQNNLKPNELAIEFSNFYKHYSASSDSTMYIAIILGHDFEFPIIIPLFEEKQAMEILQYNATNNFAYINNMYGTINSGTNYASKLYELIWEPLEQYLKGISTIYYSPSGLMHNISFAALSNENHEFLCDKYSLNLISSTSQIRETDYLSLTINSIAVFGGIEYNTSHTQNKIWNYLEGTKLELEVLSKLFNEAKIETKVFKGCEATEDAFKQISQSVDVIHIATHGFFYPDPSKFEKEQDKSTTLGEVAFRGGDTGFGLWGFVKNPNPLMRSGLVFAGANNVWNDMERDPAKQDGVLTAHEVANLNLQNTQLVVLSACETGLGEIRGSEGVYGLQRAFKMAGVQNIIMSLWEVPDKETVEFMEIFYTKLLDYKDVRKSFNETQREMRQKYDPFFWAAFVLIE